MRAGCLEAGGTCPSPHPLTTCWTWKRAPVPPQSLIFAPPSSHQPITRQCLANTPHGAIRYLIRLAASKLGNDNRFLRSMQRELPEDHFGPMLPRGAYRESSFLRNPRLPLAVKQSQVYVAICTPGSMGPYIKCAGTVLVLPPNPLFFRTEVHPPPHPSPPIPPITSGAVPCTRDSPVLASAPRLLELRADHRVQAQHSLSPCGRAHVSVTCCDSASKGLLGERAAAPLRQSMDDLLPFLKLATWRTQTGWRRLRNPTAKCT